MTGGPPHPPHLLDLSASITRVAPAIPMHTHAAIQALPLHNSDMLFFHNCLVPIWGNSQLHNQEICIFPTLLPSPHGVACNLEILKITPLSSTLHSGTDAISPIRWESGSINQSLLPCPKERGLIKASYLSAARQPQRGLGQTPFPSMIERRVYPSELSAPPSLGGPCYK